MSEDRRNKYTKDYTTNSEPFRLSLDINALDILCSFILSKNDNIKRSHYINMKFLFTSLDIVASSNGDSEKLNRFNFIRRGLEARVDNNYSDPTIILSYINGGVEHENIIPLDKLRELNNDEIEWVNQVVTVSIKNGHMDNHVDKLLELCSEYKTINYIDRDTVTSKLEDCLKVINTDLRKASYENVNDAVFSLKPGIFESRLKDIHLNLRNPDNKLKSGMQGLNQMLGGGFQNERIYLLFGLPGEGKSLALLNLAYQIKKYNTDYKLKDKTKIPCVVFLTMENGMSETVDRLMGISTGLSLENERDLQSVLIKARTEGGLRVTADSPIDLVVKFVPGMTVTTDYLYKLYDELQDSGYEPICIIQDYLKRIRSSNSNYASDIRIELGAVVNEFKTFAQDKNIPIISASQLNRDAAKHIDEGRQKKRTDTIKILGRSNIGESLLILENADAVIMIVPEYDMDGHKYMGLQLVKKRFSGGNRDTFFQPFESSNSIKLIEDEGLAIPLFKETMNPNISNNTVFSGGTSFGNKPKMITNIEGSIKLPSSVDNIYNAVSATTYMDLPTVAYKPELNPVCYRFNDVITRF